MKRGGGASPFIFWLVAIVIGAIAYVSLYPFNPKAGSAQIGVLTAIRDLTFARAGREDRLSNVLLYIPLGFVLLLALETRLARLPAIVLSVLCAAVLSFSMEVSQTYVSERVPSLMDFALNTLGAAIGATGGIFWRTLTQFVRFPFGEDRARKDASASVVIFLWLAWRWAPFVPSIDLKKMRGAFRPLLSLELDVTSIVVYLICWLAVSQALYALVSQERALEALLVLIAAVLIGRVLVDVQAFVPAEIFALVALLPTLILLNRLHPGMRRAGLAVAVAGLLVFERLSPFDFSSQPHAFDLWPFLPWMQAGFPIAWVALFRQLFLYSALLWLLKEAGLSLTVAAGALFAIVAITEVLQLWLPGHPASITDPAVAAILGLAFRQFHRRVGAPRLRGP
jgi:VanZ family protein